MKKQFNSGRFLLTIMILFAAVYMIGCKKTNTSIVGTWSPSKYEQVTKVSGTTTQDTTITNTTVLDGTFGFSSITFNSNGQYSELVYPSGADSTGNYTYSGGLLLFSSGVQAHNNNGAVNASVSGNTITITTSLDTILTSPLTTQQSYITLTN